MISVALIWLYMTVTCYVIGFACIRVISDILLRTKRFRAVCGTDCLYAGIGAITVYSQFYSIFGKVGLGANIGLLFICALCILLYKKDYLERLHDFRLTITPGRIAVTVFLFLFFAYGTSFGIIHYDTSLYHAQSIRWIEEYGVVPGLGNLHTRLAYNSSAFCLSALYSMAFLGGQSFHCCAGYLAFLLAVVCKGAFRKERLLKPGLSDFVKIIGIYYLLMIFDEMVSPASDYFMVLLVFYIVIRWLELLEKKENSYLPYGLLSLLCITVLTIKLSGALILLLTLKPAVMLIREKKGKEITFFLLTGFVMALPFFIRNVILSGWLIYPFTAVDLFEVDFKIPKGVADYDAKEIQVWGRGYSDVTAFDAPISSWLPGWIGTLDMTDKIFLVLAVAGLVLFGIMLVYALIRKKREMADVLHVMGVLAICFLFWLCSAPLIRYGCIFLWLTPVLIWGSVYLRISPQTDRYRLYLAALALLAFYKMGAFGMEVAGSATDEYLVVQKDYENYETIPYEIDGHTFYYPAEGDRTGYAAFPSVPVEKEVILRGEELKDGFKSEE